MKDLKTYIKKWVSINKSVKINQLRI